MWHIEFTMLTKLRTKGFQIQVSPCWAHRSDGQKAQEDTCHSKMQEPFPAQSPDLETTDPRKKDWDYLIHPTCYRTALFPWIRNCSPTQPWGLNMNLSDGISVRISYNLHFDRYGVMITAIQETCTPRYGMLAGLFPFSIVLNHFSSFILVTVWSVPICHLPCARGETGHQRQSMFCPSASSNS